MREFWVCHWRLVRADGTYTRELLNVFAVDARDAASAARKGYNTVRPVPSIEGLTICKQPPAEM